MSTIKIRFQPYQTLYECLEKIAIISAPIAPFYMDQLFKDLNSVSKKYSENCVHLSDFPKSDVSSIDIDLEKKMDIAQKITTMVLSLRKKERVLASVKLYKR